MGSGRRYNGVVKPTVYIETTIPSYYCDERVSLAREIARTREWWDLERERYECFVSPVVLDELSSGAYPSMKACLTLVAEVPMVEVVSDIVEIAEVYQGRGVMPKVPVRDAFHLPLASYYRMDYLLTWNCRHLANANKTRRIEAVNIRLGLSVPQLVTPDFLQPWEEES